METSPRSFDSILANRVFTDHERDVLRRLYAVDAESARISAQRILDTHRETIAAIAQLAATGKLKRRSLWRRTLDMAGF